MNANGSTGTTAGDLSTAEPAPGLQPAGRKLADRSGTGMGGMFSLPLSRRLTVRITCSTGLARTRLAPDIDTTSTCLPTGDVLTFGDSALGHEGALRLELQVAQPWRLEVFAQ